MNIYIYTLSDPRTNEPRYVGKTNDLSVRMKGHLKDKDRSKKTSWIKSLDNLGLKPNMEVLDVCTKATWSDTEIYWISQLRDWGFNLTNHSKGGHYCGIGIGCEESTKHKLRLSTIAAWERGCYVHTNMKRARAISIKARKANLKPVEMYKDDKLTATFNSLPEAAETLKYNIDRIREVIKGYKNKGNGLIRKVNSYKGYVFKYKS